MRQDERFSLEEVRAVYDALAPEYDGLFDSPVDAAENEALKHLLRERVFGRVLDVGCGTGLLLDLLEDIAPNDYLGIDVSPGMLEIASQKHPRHNFILADAQNLHSLAAGTFDTAVSLFACLSYTPDPKAVVDECHRLLRFGGRAILMVYGPRRCERAHGVHKDAQSRPAYRMFSATEVVALMDGGMFATTVRGFSSMETDLLDCEKDVWAASLLDDHHGRLAEDPDAAFFLVAEGEKL